MVKNKIFSKMVVIMSACNLIQAGAGMIGFPLHDEACVVQAALANFGAKGSWFFALLLGYQLRHQLNHGKVAMSMSTAMLLFCGVQLISMLMPYFVIGDGYGLYPAFKGRVQCFIYSPDLIMWYDATFINWTVWVLVTVVGLSANSLLLILDAPALKLKFSPETYAKAAHLRYSSQVYLAIVLIVYLPLAVVNMYLYIDMRHTQRSLLPTEAEASAVRVACAWGNLDGFLTGIAYFYNGEEARRRWFALLDKYVLGRCWLSGVQQTRVAGRFIVSSAYFAFEKVACVPIESCVTGRTDIPTTVRDESSRHENTFDTKGKPKSADHGLSEPRNPSNPRGYANSHDGADRSASATASASSNPLHTSNEGSGGTTEQCTQVSEMEATEDFIDDDALARDMDARYRYADVGIARSSIVAMPVIGDTDDNLPSLGNWISSKIQHLPVPGTLPTTTTHVEISNNLRRSINTIDRVGILDTTHNSLVGDGNQALESKLDIEMQQMQECHSSSV